MSWKWRKIDANNWQYDDKTSITRDFSGQWYIVHYCKWGLENYADATGAMHAAEERFKR